MSAEGACVWKVGQGELTNPPMLSGTRSLNIDAEYVFISLNTIIIMNLHIADGHYLLIISIIIIIIFIYLFIYTYSLRSSFLYL